MFVVIVFFVLLHISCCESHSSYSFYSNYLSRLFNQSKHKWTRSKNIFQLFSKIIGKPPLLEA